MLISSINFTEFSHQAVSIDYELSLLTVQPPLASLFPISWLIFFHNFTFFFATNIYQVCHNVTWDYRQWCNFYSLFWEGGDGHIIAFFLFSSSLSHFHSLIPMDRFVNSAVVFVLTFTDLYVSNPICVNLLFGVGWLLPPSFFIPC